MKVIQKILIIFIMLAPAGLLAGEGGELAVAPFQVNGPPNQQYLGAAAQDALMGSLNQRGYSTRALEKTLDPDRLDSVKRGGKGAQWVIAGRINVVGSQYRVRLKWVDAAGRSGEDYLQVDQLNDLIPELEKFAQQKVILPTQVVSAPEPAPPPTLSEPPAAEAKAQPKVKTELPAPEPQVAPPPPEPTLGSLQEKGEAIEELKTGKKPKPQQEVFSPEAPKYIRGYDYISNHLPFEVRGMAYGDVNGDGQKEVVLTSQQKLYLYRMDGEQLLKLGEYSGKNLDYFVKVAVYRSPSGESLIALTNLRGDQAASKLLKVQGTAMTPWVEEIPFQLRVVKLHGQDTLIGSPYYASNPARHNIFKLGIEGNQVKSQGKFDLPGGTNLYGFNFVQGSGSETKGVVTMSPSGKLRYYELEGDKYKKVWTSRENYGGSGNFIPVEVKNVFNEVIADYYSLPPGVLSLDQGGNPEVVVAKNDSLVKNIIGRVPVIADGRIFRLKLDQMGFVETWESKKVEGSIQDYLIDREGVQPKLLTAVRLRSPGLFGDMKNNPSVLLIYNLN